MSNNNWNPTNEKVGHQARGHGYKARSTYPLTAAMTDTSKPQSELVEGQGNGMRAPGPRTAETATGQPGMPKPSMDGTVVGSEKNEVNYVQSEKLGRKVSHKPELGENVNAKLANPLGDLTDEEVMRNAAEFAQANDLPVDWFKKGAVLAKRPWKFEELSQLDEEDRAKLREERDHPYRQPKILYNLVSGQSPLSWISVAIVLSYQLVHSPLPSRAWTSLSSLAHSYFTPSNLESTRPSRADNATAGWKDWSTVHRTCAAPSSGAG